MDIGLCNTPKVVLKIFLDEGLDVVMVFGMVEVAVTRIGFTVDKNRSVLTTFVNAVFSLRTKIRVMSRTNNPCRTFVNLRLFLGLCLRQVPNRWQSILPHLRHRR